MEGCFFCYSTLMWYVYILLCADNSLYTGITNDIDKRLADHKAGIGGAYTRSHKPLKMVYTEQVSSRSDALRREFEIKSWPRAKKIHSLRLSI